MSQTVILIPCFIGKTVLNKTKEIFAVSYKREWLPYRGHQLHRLHCACRQCRNS